MSDERMFSESPKEQGAAESVAYRFDTSPWGGSPDDVVVRLIDRHDEDVSAAKLTGEATISGDYITTPNVHSLTAREWYWLRIRFTSLGNTLEAWCEIKCTP